MRIYSTTSTQNKKAVIDAGVHSANNSIGLEDWHKALQLASLIAHFDKLPDCALIAIKSMAAILGKGVSTAWRDVKHDPDFPKPIHLGAGCTRFKVGDIRAYIDFKVACAPPNRLQQGRKIRGSL